VSPPFFGLYSLLSHPLLDPPQEVGYLLFVGRICAHTSLTRIYLYICIHMHNPTQTRHISFYLVILDNSRFTLLSTPFSPIPSSPSSAFISLFTHPSSSPLLLYSRRFLNGYKGSDPFNLHIEYTSTLATVIHTALGAKTFPARGKV